MKPRGRPSTGGAGRDHARTILVVDDNEDFREGLAELLRADGYRVLAYAQPSALPSLDGLSGVSLVICDYDLPGQDGLAFADAFHRAHPGVPIVLATAYWSLYLAGQVGVRSFLHLRRKPLDYGELERLFHYLAA
jgi:CheY-like chemotaxis protein